jgi:fatty-acyl-CoA synthase
MFHALGFLHATIAMMLGSTLVLRRRFKPATVLADIEKHRVTAIVVVPVMLSRILDELEKTDANRTCRACASCSSPGRSSAPKLASRAMKDIGPVVYNLYGSTEIAFATIARPQDLKKNPATVGPIVKGVRIKPFDENGKKCPRARSAGSSSATPSRSRATPVAAANRSSRV